MSWTHTFALSALVLLSSCLTKDNPIVELPEDTKNPIQKTIDELPLVVCDPLDGGEQGTGSSSVDSNQGVKGRLFEGHVKINHFENLVDPNTKDAIQGNSTLMDAQILMQNLDVPTRAFSEGFKIGEERYVLGNDGEILMEDFGIQFESRLALGNLEPGYYELALLSDDGSILKIDTENDVSDGVYDHTLLDTNFVTPTRMSCANDLVRIDESTTLPFELNYFQGPRYHIALVMLARKVKDLDAASELLISNPNSDPECGQKGNSRFFNSNNNSVPTQRFNDLLARDWKVLSNQNFRLPGEEDVNYCIEGTNIIIDRNNCFREDVKHSTAQEFEFLGDFDQVDFETISVAIDGEFVESESFNIDYLNERLQFSTNPSDGSANLRVTYCLKDEVSVEDQGPEAYFSYEIDENDPLTVYFEILSEAKGDATIESARYVLNGGADTIELSDTSLKSWVPYTFGDPNFYNVELIVTDSEGRSESFSRVLDLTAESHPPVVNFEVSQINTTEIFLDLNKSFALQGYLEAGEIDFGDGTKRPIESLFETYTYASQGDYWVTVAMRDSFGNVSETYKQISVDNTFATHPPVADFYIDKLDFAGGFRFYFAESGSPNGEIVDFTWQLGDGQIASGEEAMHFYEPGVYDVTLRVEDELGLTDTQTQRIVVHGGEPFIANISCSNQDPVTNCSWSVLDSTKNLQSVTIDWGDGFQETLPIFNQEYELYRGIFYEYPANGDYEITIQASNGNGDTASAIQQVSIRNAEDDNSGGGDVELFANFRCEVAPLNLNCTPYSLDQNAQFKWSVDGQEVSEEKILDYNFSQRGTYEVGLEVFDSNGASDQKANIFQVPELLNELISGELNCIREESLKTRCTFTPFSSEVSYNYRWFVDGIETSTGNFDNQIRHEFFTFGEHEIKVLASNEFFESSFEEPLLLNYEAPLADFSYALAQGDKMSLDASASESQDRHVQQFEWLIEGEDAFTTATPDFEIAFERVANKKVTLTVSDDSGNSDSIEKVIAVDENYKAPVVNIEISQRRGRADRTVKFDASQSYDPNNQELNFRWTVDDQIFTQEVFSYDFSGHGEYEVSLEVTNASGRSQTSSDTLTIEPLKIDRYWKTSFDPADNFVIFAENYRPDNRPRVFFDTRDGEIEIELAEITNSTWTTFFPIHNPTEEEGFDYRVIVDDFEIEKTFFLNEIILSDTPVDDIKVLADEYLEFFKGGYGDIPELNDFEGLIIETLERYKIEVENAQNPLIQKYSEYFFRSFLNNAKRIKARTSFFSRGDKRSGLLDAFMNKAHAGTFTERELNNRADSCHKKLLGSNIGEGLVTVATMTKIGAAGTLFALSLSSGGLTAAASAKLLSLTVAASITEITTKLINISLHKKVVDSCLDNVLFPYEGGRGADKVELEFTSQDVKHHNGRPLVASGAATDVKIHFPLVKFNYEIGSLKNGAIFKKIDSSRNLYKRWFNPALTVTSGLLSLLNVFNRAVAFGERFGGEFFSWMITGSDQLASYQELEDLKQRFERLNVGDNYITGDRVLSIQENQLSESTGKDIAYISSDQGGSLITKIRSISSELVKPKVKKGKTDYFSPIPKTDLQSYYVKGVCHGDRVYRHSSLGGWVSENSNVAPEVKMTNTSYVCGKSHVDKGYFLGLNTTIEDSDLLGCGQIGNSKITGGSVLKDGVTVRDSQVDGLKATGSANCNDEYPFGGVRLDGVSSPSGVEITFDKEQRDVEGNTLVVSLSGDIKLGANVRILNSQIYGKASITGSTVQHIKHSSISNLDFTMVGGSIDNTSIYGTSSSQDHKFEINGDVELTNGSVIEVFKESGFSKISKGSLNGEVLSINNSTIKSPLVKIEGKSKVIDSTWDLVNENDPNHRYLGKTIDVKDTKVLNSTIINSSLADESTVKNSTVQNSTIAKELYLEFAGVYMSFLGELVNIRDSGLRYSTLGDNVVVADNQSVRYSTLSRGVQLTNTKNDASNITAFSTIGRGVKPSNTTMIHSSASPGTILNGAYVKYTDLKGSSEIDNSSVDAIDETRREIRNLTMHSDSSLGHGGPIGSYLKIEDSRVVASKVGATVTIDGDSDIGYYSTEEHERLEIGDFSQLSNAIVSNSTLMNSVEVRGSEVRDSTLKNGAKVLSSSLVYSLSSLGEGVTVQDKSEIKRSNLAGGVTVGQSKIEDVDIAVDKQRNYCNAFFVDKPKIYIDSWGEEVENPCYNPIYTPEE